jgi:hypothetical protein
MDVNISCFSPINVSVNLYRNGTKVDNPDSNLFSTEGTYVYVCNTTTENQNYTFANLTRLLTVTKAGKITLLEPPKSIIVYQNSSNSTLFKVLNLGNSTLQLQPSILGLNSRFYSISPPSLTLNPTENKSLNVTFYGEGQQIGNYNLSLIIQFGNISLTHNFSLSVLPSQETVNSIKNDISSYKSQLSSILDELSRLKARNKTTEEMENLYKDCEETLSTAESYLNRKEYFRIPALLDSVRDKIVELNNLIASAPEEEEKPEKGPEKRKEGGPSILPAVLGVIAVIVIFAAVGFLVIYPKLKREKPSVIGDAWEELKKKWKYRHKST